MMPHLVGMFVIAAAACLACDGQAEAQTQSSVRVAKMRVTGSDFPFRYARRSGPQVRGYVARRGGYSYTPEDVINTYGDSRTRYGGVSIYRDPLLGGDRQSPAGPFDHGFFFDSGITRHGGESPYQN